eukprot:Colp12_sorted_trinity150504_noHs@7565
MHAVRRIAQRPLFQSYGSIAQRGIGTCCIHPYFQETDIGDKAFSVRTNYVKFGRGVVVEAGPDMRTLLDSADVSKERSRVALFTDKNLSKMEVVAKVKKSLVDAGIDVAVYDSVAVEPTDSSFMAGAQFFKEGRFTGVVSVGGGSVMDSAKAALLYGGPHAPPNGDFLYYVNAPVGGGNPVPTKTPLPPHIAIPTTAGTGSECTGFAICKIEKHPFAAKSKTGIASPALCPTLAIIDPTTTHTLPKNVIAASGFDVLSHAIESYTARPFTKRPATGHQRPINQGANPYSDFACLEALRVVGEFFERAVNDPSDLHAREQMMWASTIAGTAMGNAGVHLPHGLSYPVCGHVSKYVPDSGYPSDKPLIPHGMGVILCAPASVRLCAPHC